MMPAVFLDRDGTLNEEVHYLYKPSDLKIFPGVANAIRLLKQAGFLIIVVTNQAGVARGYYTCEDVEKLHRYMNELLAEEGAAIDAFYYCPHHPEAGKGIYRRPCRCRKPGIGMFEMAERDFAIDRAGSYMVGDKKLDIEAGRNYGVRSILVGTGYGAGLMAETMVKGEEPFYDFYAETLMDAAEYIIAGGRDG